MIRETVQKLNGWVKLIPIYAVLLGFAITGISSAGAQGEKNKHYDEQAAKYDAMARDFYMMQADLITIKEQNRQTLSELNDIKRILAEGPRRVR